MCSELAVLEVLITEKERIVGLIRGLFPVEDRHYLIHYAGGDRVDATVVRPVVQPLESSLEKSVEVDFTWAEDDRSNVSTLLDQVKLGLLLHMC